MVMCNSLTDEIIDISQTRLFRVKSSFSKKVVINLQIIAELRRAKCARRASWVRFFWEIYPCENFGYGISTRLCIRTVGEGRQPLGAGVFRQYSLTGNRMAALHLATCIFLVGNHISDKQWDKEQERAREKRRRNLRILCEESLDRSQRRRRRKNFNEKHCEAERNRVRDKTLLYNS